MNQHEALKQAIRNMKDNENDKVIEYINNPETDLSYNKVLLFRMTCEYGNFEIFKILIEKDIDFDASCGKALLSAVKWSREEFVELLLNKCNVDPSMRFFKAYRSALNEHNQKIIDLFESKIKVQNYNQNEKIELCRSYIIGNNVEKFKNFLETEELSKQKYAELNTSICSRLNIEVLKLYLAKNKELKFIRVGKILTEKLKFNPHESHLSVIINFMEEDDFSYGNEVVVRKLLRIKDLKNFRKVTKLYDFDFSLFDNKILKEALKKKVDINFIKIILKSESMKDSFNEKWCEENKEIINEYPNAHVIRQFLIYKKFSLF